MHTYNICHCALKDSQCNCFPGPVVCSWVTLAHKSSFVSQELNLFLLVEAWHLVYQLQSLVKPFISANYLSINDKFLTKAEIP